MSSSTSSSDQSSSDSEDTIVHRSRQRKRLARERSESDCDSDSGCDSDHVTSRTRLRKTRRRTAQHSRTSDEPAEVAADRLRTKKRNNARVTEAVWTPAKTVRITYDIGMKHACMNPVHGKAMTTYTVLHLVSCPWKNNVSMMTATPPTNKSKLYQYCHKLCEPCLNKYGPRCFKCDPPETEKTPLLNTVFGEEAITSVKDFLDSVQKWQQRREIAEVPFLVLHCTVLGKEARLIRQRFDLRRWTVVHIVYSDVRDKMEPGGSGTNLADSKFKDSWITIMKEKVYIQNQPMVSFFGNILLNNLTFEDFKVHDVMVMYQPKIFNTFEARALRAALNSLYTYTPTSNAENEASVSSFGSCLHDAVVHTQRTPVTKEDQCLFENGNIVATQFYKSITEYFGGKIVSELEQRACLGQDLRVGDEGLKVPFHCMYIARGGEVKFRRGTNATHDVARRAGDARSRICTSDTSAYEIVCWTSCGAPQGGDFVIPGLMYKFQTDQGSALIFRPKRFFHATLPAENRDLGNEKYAAAFVTDRKSVV